MEDYEVQCPECPVCGGIGQHLGPEWWRCRQCGWDWTIPSPAKRPEQPSAGERDTWRRLPGHGATL
jgi:tRNA(Ile2) C34 agmatinyltransferase TiaS